MSEIILFAPLLGAIVCGFGWRIIGEQAAMVFATSLLFLAAILSWVVFLGFDGHLQQIPIMRWIESGTLSTDWAIRLDRLTTIMLVVVTTVSSLVHLYSFGYMDHDPQWKEGEVYKPRFFAYLSFFTFAMLSLVTADNLLQMFFGWEGVGVASYLLIGFYWRKESANRAAMKAFIVNRVGDFGFALGIFGLFFMVDSINLDDVFSAGPMLAGSSISFLWTQWNAAELLTFMLFIGAMGKSAQLFLHTWLPDAMEGPTPVSALIHAATMVTAGVFLVCRMSPIFEYAPGTLAFVTIIGAISAFIAATIGLVQTDIKRVIAYSTMSQLGYMFAAAGVGVYSAAMFHLLTHAFFKAMLFLGAGSVIHAMHHEQDMRNYGGLRSKIPMTFWAMMIGTLAITGVGIPSFLFSFGDTPIGFAGFLSKDAIVESTYGAGTDVGMFAFWALVLAAAMTAFYSWRLMFLTFYGTPRGDAHKHEHAHESPRSMLIPLGVLALGAIFSGMIWYGSFFGDHAKMNAFYGVPAHHEAAEGAADHNADTTVASDNADSHAAETADSHATQTADTGHDAMAPAMLAEPPTGAIFTHPDNHTLENAHHATKWAKVAPTIAMVLGFALAWLFYIANPSLPGRLARSQRPLYLLFLNKWYFDEIYDFIFVRGAKALGRLLWKRGDGGVIDGTINGIALGAVPWLTRLAGRAQSGFLFTYAFWMVIGIVVLVTWVTVTGGAL